MRKSRQYGALVRPSSRPKALIHAMKLGYNPILALHIDITKAAARHIHPRRRRITG